MASSQVLPTSRKQEHLEAGKRKLEEFRKKKAAERAKKAANSGQPPASDISPVQKQPLETVHVRLTDSDGAGTSDDPVEPFSVSINNGNNTIDSTKNIEQSSLNDADANPPPISMYNTSFADVVQRGSNNHDYASGFTGVASVSYGQETDEMNNDFRIYKGSQGGFPILSGHSIAPQPWAGQGLHSSSSQSSLYEKEFFQSKESNSSSKDSPWMNDVSHIFTSPPSSTSSQLQTKPTNAITPATSVESLQSTTNLRGSNREVKLDMHGSISFNNPMSTDFRERNFRSLASSLPSGHGAAVQSSESAGFNFDFISSSNHVPLYSATSETNSRRSRPSFLDSLNVSRHSLGSSFERTEPEKESFMQNTSKSNGMDVLESGFQRPSVETEIVGPLQKLRASGVPGAFEHARNFSISSSNGVDILKSNISENGMERKHEFYPPKQDEDFAALEQHIEDLTQEKFSLQRALEASRALAESLAAENSSLTDSYNQQRSIVNQLKSDMEKLKEEIKAHLVELESVKIECANAQLECTAADERAKLLASEVIGLEEKALRLRSSELKLERQLENSNAEVTSYKKKMSSLEKDRLDLQSTIDALQEEKKLLQSKLRKASASGKSIDISSSHTKKKDMSTSTEDLDAIPDTSNQETHDSASLPESDNPSISMLPENRQSNLEASSVYIPPDHMKMIQNINELISELALEKEELMQSLASESSLCSKLKDLNNELSCKLEAQTQRLEFLTAQSMVAYENMPARLPDSHTIQENSTYADEGDEVVERVLGWIMKLFPGGPSRRRPSKLL